MTFYFTAAIAVMLGGTFLLAFGSYALASNWAPLSLALTHIATLGFLVTVLMGAVYQMSPLLVGRAVGAIRLAHAVHLLLVVGGAGLVWGLPFASVPAVFASIAFLGLALVLFLVPAGAAATRSSTRDEPAYGVRLALASFALAGAMGLWMAHGHGGMRFPGPRGLWVQVHLTVALLGWVGGLIASFSWRLLPAFDHCPPFGRPSMRATLVLVAAGILLPLLVLAVDFLSGGAGVWEGAPRLATLGALPAASALWVLHPLVVLRGLHRRAGARADGSRLLWKAGLWLGPITGVAAAASTLLAHPRWNLLLGWLAIWGWSGMIIHGTLVGIAPLAVRSRHGSRPLEQRGLDRLTLLGFAVHLASVLVGAVAILSSRGSLARLTGLLLLVAGMNMVAVLLRVLRQRRAPERVISG
jgi:hypothetical protein